MGAGRASDTEASSIADLDAEGQSLDQEMKTKAVLHMAKKNLCFELEYIQAVIERIEGKVGMQPQNYKLDDDPLMALSESQNTKSAPLTRVGAAEAG